MSPLTDAAGTEHPPAGQGAGPGARPAARIVSLVPSLTELLFALGLGARVVGRTSFCHEPADRVRGIRTVGGTKTVKMERVLALRPTHAVVNVDETPEAVARGLAGHGIHVVVTHPVEVADNAGLYRLLGGIFGAAAEAEALTARFENAYRSVCSMTSRLPPQRTLYLIWKDPWMTVSEDTYISHMLALIRWQTAAPDPAPDPANGPARRYPEVELSPDLLARTDLVLFSTEPFPFTEADLEDFRAAFPAHARKARLVDGRMLGWYGSRAVEGLGYLAELAARESPEAP